MTEAEWIAVITGAPIVVVTILQLLSRRQIRAVRDQLENDHARDPHKTTNLRDDLDKKHLEVLDRIRTTGRDIGGLREDVRQLRRDLSHETGRIDELERTRPPDRSTT
jgi:hypothetical protein